MNRYFIISYIFGSSGIGTGLIGYVGTTYPNFHNLKKDSKSENFNPVSIMEVTEKDYKQFWKKD